MADADHVAGWVKKAMEESDGKLSEVTYPVSKRIWPCIAVLCLPRLAESPSATLFKCLVCFPLGPERASSREPLRGNAEAEHGAAEQVWR